MNVNFQFTALKRDGEFTFVAKDYGVVVRAADPGAGISELQQKIDNVLTQFREAGIDFDEVRNEPPERPLWPQMRAFVLKTFIVTLIAAAIITWTVVPFANVLSATFGPNSRLGFALSHPVQFLVQTSDKVDQVPLERLDELRIAVQKIASRVRPLFDEVAPSRSPSPQPPSGNPPPR